MQSWNQFIQEYWSISSSSTPTRCWGASNYSLGKGSHAAFDILPQCRHNAVRATGTHFAERGSISASLGSSVLHGHGQSTLSGRHWDGNLLIITDNGRSNCWAQNAYITRYWCVRGFPNSFGMFNPIVQISFSENQWSREVQWFFLGGHRCQTTWVCTKAAKRFHPKNFTDASVRTRMLSTCPWRWAVSHSSACSPSREKSSGGHAFVLIPGNPATPHAQLMPLVPDNVLNQDGNYLSWMQMPLWSTALQAAPRRF